MMMFSFVEENKNLTRDQRNITAHNEKQFDRTVMPKTVIFHFFSLNSLRKRHFFSIFRNGVDEFADVELWRVS